MAKKRYPDATCLCWDHGLFIEAAIALSKDFGRVLLYVPWESGYPKSNLPRIGEGIPGIERVLSPWQYYDEIDLWCFFDCYEGDLQQFLVNQGKLVWGCRLGEILELDRDKSKQHSKELGIDIGNYTVVKGMDALRAHLKTHDDQYLKVSSYRGDSETMHAPNYKHVEIQLNELQQSLGAKSNIMEFICEDGINDAIEVGYDGYVIDGKYAKSAIIGVEVKDKAYVGKTMSYERLPEKVKDVNAKLAPTLKEFGYRGFISTELRMTEDGKAYLIDPCTRMGSPPGELYGLWIDNLAEIIWEGSQGIVIEPEYTAKYGAMCLLLSDWADSNWQQVEFPDKYRDNVKLRNYTIIGGERYVIPLWTGMPEIGAVVAVGDSAKEAIDQVRMIADEVKGHSIEKPCDALEDAARDLKELLGAEPPPPTPLQRSADKLRKKGSISQRAYEKMVEKAS
jgi:hypothetical protein